MEFLDFCGDDWKDVIENPIDLRLKVIGLLDNEFHR
jgi:hypothetical protein